MKKQDVLETIPNSWPIRNLKRHKPYLIFWHGNPIIVLITHFTKYGIRVIPLTVTRGLKSKSKSFRIKYYNVLSHNFQLATLKDIVKLIRNSNNFCTLYFSDHYQKIFQKNHAHE